VQLLDLSHVVEDGMVTYPGLPGPVISDHMTFEDSRAHYAAGTEFHIGRIEMVANTGTYLDTPAHRWEGGADLSTLPLDRLAGLPGVAIRSKGPDWRTDDYGNEGHPFVGEALAEALVTANPALVGIDSVNIDSTIGGERPAHSLLLGAGILVVEHLTRLGKVPDDEFEFFAVPVKVRRMGTFPVRAFARWS